MKQNSARLAHAQIAELLTAVFTVCLLNQDVGNSTMDRLIRMGRRSARARVQKLRPERKVVVDLDVLGHVIYIWQRSPEYLDDNGRPIAVPARGAAPSIESLFHDVDREDYFKVGVRHLLRMHRIKKVARDRYIPISEVSIIDGLTPEMVKLLNSTINRLVSTVLYNSTKKSLTNARLIERVTVVPDLPLEKVGAFKKFAREQGGALINTMNDWLESRRGPRKARAISTARRVTAGLHVFSFVEKRRS